MEVSIGIRGEGDHTILADSLVHILHDVGLRFDQMVSGFFPAGSEARDEALSRYQELRDLPDR